MSSPPLITNHRLARLAVWLLALLAWFALGGHGSERQRRRAETSFTKIERAVRNLIIIRAAQLLPPRTTRPRRRHGFKPPRIRLRAVAGVWLRRRLRTRGDLVTRAAQLLAALRNWREFAGALARRRAGGLTRLARTWGTRDRAAPLRAQSLSFLRAADTS
ncbi:MAG: hypothetical protein R3C27_13185 [Hyphomonadaceae bacterium]